MATISFQAKLSNSGRPVVAPLPDVGATANTAVAAIDYSDFATKLATLVADGASPTQAHVTAVDSAWTTLKALIDAAVVAAAATDDKTTGAVVVTVDLASVTDTGKLRQALNEVIAQAIGSGNLVN